MKLSDKNFSIAKILSELYNYYNIVELLLFSQTNKFMQTYLNIISIH